MCYLQRLNVYSHITACRIKPGSAVALLHLFGSMVVKMQKIVIETGAAANYRIFWGYLCAPVLAYIHSNFFQMCGWRLQSGMESGTASSLSSGPPENGNAVMQHAPPPMTGVIASDMQDTVPVTPFEDATGGLELVGFELEVAICVHFGAP